MLRSFLRWTAALVVAAVWAAAAYAQRDTSGADESESAKVPVLAYALAFVFTIVCLVIVCMPSRKS
jgi:hypothetical protein